MNKDPYRDKAAQLKQRIEKVSPESDEKVKESLPSRSEVHQNKKTKKKFKYPLIRVLLLFFILLPLIFFSLYSILNNRDLPLNPTKASDDVEEVEIDNGEPLDNEEENIKDTQSTSKGKTVDNKDKEKETTPTSSQSKDDLQDELSLSKEVDNTKETPPQSTDSSSELTEHSTVYHTVQPKETLYRIAMKYYQSANGIEKIKSWNNLSTNEIQSGQVLEIPIDKQTN
jgi:LysM repeat protein